VTFCAPSDERHNLSQERKCVGIIAMVMARITKSVSHLVITLVKKPALICPVSPAIRRVSLACVPNLLVHALVIHDA
jgi:hypothetical protein